MENSKVLMVDDDPDVCEVVKLALARRRVAVATVHCAEEALDLAAREDFDAILTDLRMAGMDGISLCERLLGARPDVPVVVITGHGSMETAVQAIRAGAYDFLAKPIDMDVLALTVARAAQHRALRVEVRRLREATATSVPGRLHGVSPVMREVHELIARVAPSEASVLVTGESGTGKELAVRALHELSPRCAGPFVAINCAAMPCGLLESELFGHVKGAFTDAHRARTGLFVQANGGTLFLDEIGELPLDLQPKLLRALQERRVRPVGGDEEIVYDARIVASTNRDLAAEVARKRFREDLFYRIDVVRITMAPLRDRGGDILALAQLFLAREAARSHKSMRGIAPAAAAKLVAHRWPGNVRELENCIERAVAMARFDQLTVADLPERIRAYPSRMPLLVSDDENEIVPLVDLEQRYIQHVLRVAGGNKSRAADLLGLDRRTLYRKLESLEKHRSE